VENINDKLAKLQNEKIEKRTIKNGNLTIVNVPHNQYKEIGPDGETEYLAGYVVYKMAKMFRYMIDNQKTIMDFEKLEEGK
jgi:hypothetical protein